jgi:sugar phosphate isomerase/epimerase
MSSAESRRCFASRSAAAMAAAFAGASSFGRVAPSSAAEPIQRTGGPRFKFSIAGYSYRNVLGGQKPAMTLDDFIVACARMGLDGIELTTYYFPKELTGEYLRRLKRLAFRLGLDISGTGVGNDFTLPPGPPRDEQIAMVKRWIEHSAMLGAPMVRIFAGSPRTRQTEAEARRLVVAGIEACSDHAAKYGVVLALENHGGVTATAESTLRLVADVKSPWFGVNLDSGNFHSDDIYGDLARVAPYAVNVHVKVVVSGPDGKRRPTDYQRLAGVLARAGYRGYISLEYEEEADPRIACPKIVDEIRRGFAL